MFRNRLMWVVSFVVVLSLVLASCAPQTVEVIKTVEVQKEVKVVETQVVQVQSTVQVTVKETQVVTVQADPFTTPHPVLGDLKVRQALAYCTNKLELVKSVYPLASAEDQAKLPMNTFIPSSSWAYAGDANITIYPFDPAKGGALLDEAGWTLAKDATYRNNKAGDSLALKFTTTTAAFRQTWAAVWENQMKACGVQIIRQHVPASWWFGATTGLARRDFELGAFAWVGSADPGGQTLFACDQIPLPKNNWAGQNDMGWCNTDADTAIKTANNSLSQKDRQAAYTVVQAKYTAEVPAIPLFNRTNTFAVNAAITGLVPPVGSDDWVWDVANWEYPGKDTIVLGFTQEPSTLFTLVQSAQVGVTSMAVIGGYLVTSHGFGYQPRLQKELSTIDSGLAKNNDVDVKKGDIVQDSSGNIITLTVGTKVNDSTGKEVTYADGMALKMKQLVVTYNIVAGLKYSDGKPLTQADLQLGYKITCAKDSGAVSFITCDQTQKVDFTSDTSYTVTWKPGVQQSLYFIMPYGWFYGERVITSDGPYKGKTLADVPAKDWGTLKEVSESPIDVGPYMITDWKKGDSLTFEANPFYYLGKAKTAKIVVKIVAAENAEAQLLGDQVDVLDDTTLTGVSELLNKAATDGKIKVYAQPSATWEHIDFNLFLR